MKRERYKAGQDKETSTRIPQSVHYRIERQNN